MLVAWIVSIRCLVMPKRWWRTVNRISVDTYLHKCLKFSFVIFNLGACPVGFTRVPMHNCYRVTTTATTWANSPSACVNDGGQLAALETKQEFDAVIAWMRTGRIISHTVRQN